jgi:hypothetical protein
MRGWHGDGIGIGTTIVDINGKKKNKAYGEVGPKVTSWRRKGCDFCTSTRNGGRFFESSGTCPSP